METPTATTEVRLRLPKPHPMQQQIIDAGARFVVVACGRRFGKTETGKMAITARAALGQVCWWVAPTQAMASDVWRDFKRLFADHPGVKVNEGERRIDLPDGGRVAVRRPHPPDNLRGAGLDYVVLDEAAYLKPGTWAEVIRPMLLERRGGALFLSSPRGRNAFWRLYQMGRDPNEPEWAAFHFTSAHSPLIDAAELDAIQRSTPERVFREEYLAEFIDDAGQVFRGVTQAAAAPAAASPQPGHRYIMGVDWGRDHDYTVLAIVNATTAQLVALERFNQVGYPLQRGRLAALYNVWGPDVIWAEANSIGSVNIEELAREGLPVRPFTTTNRSKNALIEGLALAIERGDIALLPDPVLLDELAAYSMERLPGGGFRYGAPPGGHDDTVMATALAWYGVNQGGAALGFA